MGAELARLLLVHFADINLTNQNKKNAATVAQLNKNHSIADYLQDIQNNMLTANVSKDEKFLVRVVKTTSQQKRPRRGESNTASFNYGGQTNMRERYELDPNKQCSLAGNCCLQ